MTIPAVVEAAATEVRRITAIASAPLKTYALRHATDSGICSAIRRRRLTHIHSVNIVVGNRIKPTAAMLATSAKTIRNEGRVARLAPLRLTRPRSGAQRNTSR
jgi:hypothetical protein